MQKIELRRLPRGRVFSERELQEAILLSGLKVPLERLIEYGEECNWLTRKGKSFSSAVVFANAYNGVYIQYELGVKENDLFS